MPIPICERHAIHLSKDFGLPVAQPTGGRHGNGASSMFRSMRLPQFEDDDVPMDPQVREEKEDSRGRIKVIWVQKRRDNHYLDYELMIDAAAIITNVLRASDATS